jgi:uncharacterized protein (DUF1330 family)
MPAYMIARTTIVDREKFEQEFMPVVRQMFEVYNCKLLVQSDAVETVIGSSSDTIGNIGHLAILEFPDLAHAQACAASPEMQALKKIGANCMIDHYVRLVDGLAETKSAEPAEASAAIAAG